MSFLRPSPEQALAGLRAMKTVLTAAKPLDETRAAIRAATQRHVLGTHHDLTELNPIRPEELTEVIVEPRLRDQLSRAICFYVMVPDHAAREEAVAAERFVRALGGPEDALDRMRHVYEQRMLLLRFDAARSSFLVDGMRRRGRDEGIAGILSNVGEILGVHENPTVAARYRALGDLAEGTVGHALHTFYVSRGFAFPGEKNGAPESIIAHDLTHVLTGLDTDLPSEACVTAFQAGYRRDGPFAGLLFVLLNMEKGMKMTKLAPGARHMFGEPGMADRIVDAWKHGTDVPIDLVTEWESWKEMDAALQATRAKYGVVSFAS